MSKYLLDGLPPKVVTYIKVHLRHIYSTGLFSYQEREDLIQDLVLFYLERYYKKDDIPDALLFTAFRSKANHLMRTRLRDMQSGFFNTESLNSMFEDEGFEPETSFSLADLDARLSVNELKKFISEKEQKFVDLVLQGNTVDEAISMAHVSKNIIYILRDKMANKHKKQKK